MERLLRSMIIVSAFAACWGTKATPGDTGGPEGDADTDTDTDSDADTDTGLTGPVAALTREGLATVDGSYVGTEALVGIGDRGYGDEVCRISYDVVSIGVRADCAACDWAYDVEFRNAVVVTDVDGACLSLVGTDASNVAALDGTTHGYGFSGDYVGHAQVLLTDLPGYWGASTYASWDDETETTGGAPAVPTFEFRYEWEDGYLAY